MGIKQLIRVVAIVSFAVLVLSGCSWLQPAPKPAVQSQVAQGVMVEGYSVGNMTRAELDMVLAQVAKERNYGPVNARFDETGTIQPSKKGRALNTVRTAEQALATPANSAVSAVYDEVEANRTEMELAQAQPIGSYTTPILDNSPGRMVNLRLTAKLISNTGLEVGQEFSFNTVTGEPTAQRGFQKAGVFGAGGRKEEGLGGGMCQVSSTLYNAVLAAGLRVTERHPHSQTVAYVPYGKDATIFTNKDFRFANNTRRRIIIRAFVEGQNLTVDLWALSK